MSRVFAFLEGALGFLGPGERTREEGRERRKGEVQRHKL